MGRKSFALILALYNTCSAAADDLFANVAQYCGMPRDILYAVALVESGRKVDGHIKPWPWTLNIEGQAYYFDTREGMFQKVMNAITEKRTIDIGIMQTNWHWKFNDLRSPWKATEPLYNVKTGCSIIRKLYDIHGDWWVAVGKYHRQSNKPKHVAAATRYAARVKRAWEKR